MIRRRKTLTPYPVSLAREGGVCNAGRPDQTLRVQPNFVLALDPHAGRGASVLAVPENALAVDEDVTDAL